MKFYSRIPYFICLLMVLAGCTTGKNALQKGNYEAAVSKAVDRLKSSPKNSEALTVLSKAYDLSLKNGLRIIDEAKISTNVLRWETIMEQYGKINRMADEINGCPSCLEVVPAPRKFVREYEDARLRSAEVRYALGQNLLSENTRESAKKALQNFEMVKQWVPGYKDINNKIEDAYWASVLKVVLRPVIVNSDYYKLSSDYFQQQIENYTANYRNNKYVAFYTEKEANAKRLVPDQVINLRFDDFIVGQTYVKEKVEKLKKDSVEVGRTRDNKPVYGTVTAELSVFEKSISSSGLLGVTISDWQTRKVVTQKKLPGTFVWTDSWASYRGDERALDRNQLALTKRRETVPPPPLTLFVEFTKPIYSQFVDYLNSYYSRF